MASIEKIAEDIKALEAILRRDFSIDAEFRREVVASVFKGAYSA